MVSLALDGEDSSSSMSSNLSTSPSKVEERHVHIPCRVASALHHQGVKADDFGVVRWQENSKKHPRRWPLTRKIYDSAVIIFLEFFMTLVSNAGSSIAPSAMVDLGLDSTTTLACFTTVYLIGQAIGGLFLPPLAESFGGRGIYVCSTVGFAFFCILIAAWPVLPAIIIGRFGSGVLSAMPAVVAAGSIENMWDTRARTWIIHLWIAFAVAGLALAPPIVIAVSDSAIGWQGIFWASACVSACAALLCFGMQESRPSQLLKQKVTKVSRQTSFESLSIDGDESVTGLREFARTSLIMPVRLFVTEPIVFLTSIMAASVYGVTYLYTEAFSVIYEEGFGFTSRQSSLVFLAIGGGVIFTFLPRIYDVRVSNLRQRQNRIVEPEDKLFGFYVAAPILAIGLWWFGSTVPPLVKDITPAASITSQLLYGFAVVEFDSVLSGYLTDTYASYAASANAPMAFLRAILSGTFPLFGMQMFHNLGSNNALFLLASLATAYCGIAVWFGLNGKKIRTSSPFAEKTWAGASGSSSESLGSSSGSDVITVPERCHVNEA